ncbi:MAG: M48 family metallopeptidase [Synergistaceae bacterium]|jgi:predicted metal-dependent hydrolase|nr:M48 family metallopeptidase [Synergistaceae bacterium]
MKRSLRDGEILPYKGRQLRILTLPPREGRPNRASRARPPVEVSGGLAAIILRIPPSEDRRKRLIFWYTSETEEIVRSLVPAWSKKIGVRPRLASVKYALTRWGSCSRSGALFFNSRLAMLSDSVAEYVIVHELCHLKHMNHSKAFWDEVESALPGSKGLRRRLRDEEQSAWI